MNHEKNIDKIRILTLMSLAENNKELPFDLLQKQLRIEADEIESFVIDGKLKTNLSTPGNRKIYLLAFDVFVCYSYPYQVYQMQDRSLGSHCHHLVRVLPYIHQTALAGS